MHQLGDASLFSFLTKRNQLAGVAGIELSRDGVALARCVRRNHEPPRLLQCEFRPLSAEERNKPQPTLAREWQLDRSRCVSVMQEAGFTLLLVEAPHVDASELKAAIRWRIKDLLDFHVDDAVIDVFDIPGQQERGRAKLMYVVAARVTSVRQHIDQWEASGAQLAAIDIPELCQRNVASLLPEDASGVALLRLGDGGGLLTITRQNALYLARNMDVGSDDLLSATFDAPEMTPELARMLDGVVLEVQRSLDYYESHFSLPPVSALVVVPTPLPIPGMIGHLAGNLGVPVRLLDLNEVIATDKPLSDDLQASCFSAIGAALRHEEKAL